MKSCLKCGNAIGEPGKAYGYAGTWCHCVDPKPDAYPPVSGFPEIGKPQKLSDYIEEMQRMGNGKIVEVPPGADLMKYPPGPVIRLPPEPTDARMTPVTFVYWLRGYFAAGGPHAFTQGDWKRIAEELAKVCV